MGKKQDNSNLDLQNYISNKVSEEVKNQLQKYLYYFSGAFVVISFFLAVGVLDFFSEKIVLSGLKERAAISYQKNFYFSNTTERERSIDFLALSEQSVYLKISSHLITNEPLLDNELIISIDGVDITNLFVDYVYKFNNQNNEIVDVTDHLRKTSELYSSKVHTLRFNYNPRNNDSKEFLIKNLLIVQD